MHFNSKMFLYADDTTIFNYGKTIQEVQKNLQDDLDTICRWLDLNNMNLHPQKTKVMAFGHKKKIRNNVLLIKFRNVFLENVKKIKYLGVILDTSMTWNEHVTSVVGKNFTRDRLYSEDKTSASIQNSEEFVFFNDFALY